MRKVYLCLALFITTIIIFSGCTKSLKRNNDCFVEESWSLVKGHEYEDFEKAWGNPDHEYQREETDEITCVWKVPNLFKKGGKEYFNDEIDLTFDRFWFEIGNNYQPMGKVKYGHCTKMMNGQKIGDLIQ